MIEVIHFQRKRRANGNHSVESYFKGIRDLQPKDILVKEHIFNFVSSGIIKRLSIVLECFFSKKKINHNTGDIHFANILLPKKSNILTIHDCGILKKHSKGIKHKIIKFFWFTLPSKKASIITVNSNFTKQDLLKYISFPEEKILPIYIFVPKIHKYHFKEFNASKPTILQLGTAPNKNIIRTAEALNGISCTFVILGKLNNETIDALLKYKIDFKNISTSINDIEVADLYKNCDIVSFVSTFEGFGMPIVEANVTGRVVITSNTASMPEIANNAAHIVNPFDIQDIKKGFLKVIENKLYREELIKNGFENAKRFNQEKIAVEYYDIYRKISKVN